MEKDIKDLIKFGINYNYKDCYLKITYSDQVHKHNEITIPYNELKL
ncbi:hypothetical protein [Acholeplasma hippikon]|uniref:Uncharacterized protein n=1 Tax=Acholeplasma hippikon TaxID=264636 RepID=A0A449BKZ1_9MOLU|nr:hypothetical protein [Acholeplasma hippikon]VEU83141.1 Uncharacterised protein [Acholeplasma hippikon]VEU83348.1 Uncharacterised protein [Acholeplasma hippikon]